MTPAEPGEPEELYAEPGASWWGLLFGPVFAGIGIGLELLMGGPVFWGLWITVVIVLGLFSLLWVYARRRYAQVRVTAQTLTQGSEKLAVEKIKQVSDSTEEPLGVKVLGGGQGVPRKYGAVTLRLTDGTRVVAWARDGDALRAALRSVVQA